MLDSALKRLDVMRRASVHAMEGKQRLMSALLV